MKPKVKLAVARIISLQAEFTPAELKEALHFIESASLSKIFETKTPKTKTALGPNILHKKTDRKQAITPTDTTNITPEIPPEKLQLLSDLEHKLRSGELLTRLDSIRKIAVSIDKSYYVGKSRKEAVPKFLELLSNSTTLEIKDVIERISSTPENAGSLDEGYLNLAKYLVRGKTT